MLGSQDPARKRGAALQTVDLALRRGTMMRVSRSDGIAAQGCHPSPKDRAVPVGRLWALPRGSRSVRDATSSSRRRLGWYGAPQCGGQDEQGKDTTKARQ